MQNLVKKILIFLLVLFGTPLAFFSPIIFLYLVLSWLFKGSEVDLSYAYWVIIILGIIIGLFLSILLLLFTKKKGGLSLNHAISAWLLGMLIVIFIITGLFLPRPETNRNPTARIQADMGQLRALAELVYDENATHSYLGLCDQTLHKLNTTNGTYKDQLLAIASDIDEQNGDGKNLPTCYSSATDYCVSASTTWATICVSSNGRTGSIACTSANTNCQ